MRASNKVNNTNISQLVMSPTLYSNYRKKTKNIKAEERNQKGGGKWLKIDLSKKQVL